MLGIGLDALIYLILPASGAAVEAVAEVVLGELVLDAVEGDLSLVDTVRITADRSAEIRLVILREVVGNLVEAEDDILHLTLVVRDEDGNDAAAEVGDTYFHTITISKGVKGGGCVVVGVREVLGVESGGRQGRLFGRARCQDEEASGGNECSFHMCVISITNIMKIGPRAVESAKN